MWKLQANFITLHYAYILFLGLLGLVVLYPYGNLRAIDAYFFGVSSSTESGLNTVDVKDLKLYQQLFIYFVPIVSNLGFINILVVVVRLLWFEKRLKEIAPGVLDRKSNPSNYDSTRYDPEAHPRRQSEPTTSETVPGDSTEKDVDDGQRSVGSKIGHVVPERPRSTGRVRPENDSSDPHPAGLSRSISFADTTKALYIPSPQERDRGVPIAEVQRGPGKDVIEEEDEDAETERRNSENTDDLLENGRSATSGLPFERVASSLFVIGKQPSRAREPSLRPAISLSKDANLPDLSVQATLGRNSQFHNLTAADRERLGGIEYRSLKLLLKIVIGYFVGLHVFGVVCLVPWILHSNRKYRDYLDECGQNEVWWAIYSAQTMTSNLGLTLTPDSMISFNDAVFPMLIMSFLAYAGNTLYPCCLRLLIWGMSKCIPESSSLKEPLEFLLKYPRRCYLLLFRSKPTWILFGIIFVLNFVDVLLILVLDLDNPAVNDLPGGPRVAAAIFQSASSRHTGTASFNLADVNPAVQFSLLVMMYISVFPIAISVRASNIYEEKSIGVFSSETDMDEGDGKRYVLMHMRNQLSFDLWYIFLGIMCICIAESGKIMDPTKPAFSVFAIFFEVVSAYGNVGLSLGYPTASTSFSAQFDIFSKIVICAMMIRGRHRGLPYQLDRAILIPNNRLVEDDKVETRPSISLPRIRSMDPTDSRYMKMKKAHTR
ncbi:cation transporter [Aspergillus piperis CBS 112811]|uniref:Potassium transport protein n=1 Tax=Aspergillus piperis CBS 112811 TaxID=1448313 RepID=A0A8G1QUU1_9EURO|nr:cation transporter [Aspergillus piperis CBS 112811]RAH54761.1 cation transporter [Aspergillus piperis CBS 112811]